MRLHINGSALCYMPCQGRAGTRKYVTSLPLLSTCLHLGIPSCRDHAGSKSDGVSSTSDVRNMRAQLLEVLYDKDVVEEDAFLQWAQEKEHGDEEDRIFLNKAQHFIDWLQAAEEESDDEEGEDSD